MIKNIGVAVVRQWVKNNEILLIDVREAEEYEENHIENALLIPLGRINKGALPNLEGKKLVLYCRSGNRSRMGCENLFLEDSTLELYNMQGGIREWMNHHYPTQPETQACPSL